MYFIRLVQQSALEAFAMMRKVLEIVFSSDEDLISDEFKKILSNPKDKEELMKGIDKLKTQPEVEITLSNKRTLTLVQ